MKRPGGKLLWVLLALLLASPLPSGWVAAQGNPVDDVVNGGGAVVDDLNNLGNTVNNIVSDPSRVTPGQAVEAAEAAVNTYNDIADTYDASKELAQQIADGDFSAMLNALIEKIPPVGISAGAGVSVAAAVEADSSGRITSELRGDAYAGYEVNVGDDTVVEGGGEAGFEYSGGQPGTGDTDSPVSASVRADVEASLSAGIKAGMWVEKMNPEDLSQGGLFIGADAHAGAYIKAGIEGEATVNFLGIDWTGNIRAEASAGLMAKASAVVQIGFDGMISWDVEAGVTVGIGASVSVSMAVSIDKLIGALADELGIKITDLEDLIDWVSEFAADPVAYLGGLMGDFTGFLLGQLAEAGWQMLTDIAEWGWQMLQDFWNWYVDLWTSVWEWLFPQAPPAEQEYEMKLKKFM